MFAGLSRSLPIPPGASTRVIFSTRPDSGSAISRAYVARSERKIDPRDCSWYMPGIVAHQPFESVSGALAPCSRFVADLCRQGCGQPVQNCRTRTNAAALVFPSTQGRPAPDAKNRLHGPYARFGHGHCDNFAPPHRSPSGGVFLLEVGLRGHLWTSDGTSTTVPLKRQRNWVIIPRAE